MPTFVIAAGTTSQPHNVPAGALVKVSPAAGASAVVEYTKDGHAAIKNGVATWLPWPKGPVSTEAADLANNPAYVRVTANSGAVTLDVDTTPGTEKRAAFRGAWGGTVSAATDSAGNTTGLMGADGWLIPGTQQPAPGNVLANFGKLVFDPTLGDAAKTYNAAGTAITIGYITATSAPSLEYSRFSNATRKVTVTSNSAQVRFNNINITVDPVVKGLEMAVYLPTIPSELLGAGNNPGITIRFCDTLGGSGGKSDTWLFDGSCLRQGWNTLRMFASDSITGVSGQGQGNLPPGVAHAGSNPIDWTQPIMYMEINFNNWLNVPFGTAPTSYSMYFDQLRKASKANSVLVIGFDAAGANSGDDVFVAKVAPLFAKYGIRGYVTATGAAGNSSNSGDLTYAGGPDWTRRITLQNQYGWDIINHTWNHGGLNYGRSLASGTSGLTISRTSNVVTVNYATGHNLNVGSTIMANISGVTAGPEANGVWTALVTSSTAFQYTAAGVDFGSTGNVAWRTIMSEIYNPYNTDPNVASLVKHEVKDMSDCLRGTGFARASHILAYPNNSVPDLTYLGPACAAAGVKYGRGSRGGNVFINEFGVDNPLHFGSWEMGSSVTTGGTDLVNDTKYTLQYMKDKIQGAVDRGEHIWLYGHFIIDENNPPISVNTDYPPGYKYAINNPTPTPALGASAGGGWWYLGTLEKLIRDCIMPLVAAGKLRVMTPSDWAAHLGNPK